MCVAYSTIIILRAFNVAKCNANGKPDILLYYLDFDLNIYPNYHVVSYRIFWPFQMFNLVFMDIEFVE